VNKQSGSLALDASRRCLTRMADIQIAAGHLK